MNEFSISIKNRGHKNELSVKNTGISILVNQNKEHFKERLKFQNAVSLKLTDTGN
jgi:hypothetical protein